jgi:pyrroloquinoline-quinone synthase
MEDERHVLPPSSDLRIYVWFCKSKPWVQAVASSLTELFAPKFTISASVFRSITRIPPEALDYFKNSWFRRHAT